MRSRAVAQHSAVNRVALKQQEQQHRRMARFAKLRRRQKDWWAKKMGEIKLLKSNIELAAVAAGVSVPNSVHNSPSGLKAERSPNGEKRFSHTSELWKSGGWQTGTVEGGASSSFGMKMNTGGPTTKTGVGVNSNANLSAIDITLPRVGATKEVTSTQSPAVLGDGPQWSDSEEENAVDDYEELLRQELLVSQVFCPLSTLDELHPISMYVPISLRAKP